MDQFDFRGTPQASRGLDLSRFIHSQEVSEALQTGTANKQAEIAALLERARMNNEAHLQGIEINRASQEGIAAAHDANILKIHEKDTLTGEQIDAINAANPGLNLPRVDGLPVQTAATLIGVVTAADRDASREKIAQAHDLTRAQIASGTQKYIADKEAATAANRLSLEKHRLVLEGQGQQKINELKANKEKELHQQTAAALMPENIPGDKTTGVKPGTDLTDTLLNDPSLALQIADEIRAGGGLPKGPLARKVALPTGIAPEPGTWERIKPWGPSNQELNTRVQSYKANLPEFYARAGMAPPTTGPGGAALTKPKPGTIPKELESFNPLSPSSPSPAATQNIPSAMGGFESKVGTQPQPTVPGPSAISPPSAPLMTQPRPTIIRVAPDGRKIEYDAVTKQPLRVVQ